MQTFLVMKDSDGDTFAQIRLTEEQWAELEAQGVLANRWTFNREGERERIVEVAQ